MSSREVEGTGEETVDHLLELSGEGTVTSLPNCDGRDHRKRTRGRELPSGEGTSDEDFVPVAKKHSRETRSGLCVVHVGPQHTDEVIELDSD